MTAIAIDKTTWDSLTPGQRLYVATCELGPPTLGDPAIMVDENGTEWCVFDDGRLTEDQVATVAALMANPTQIPEVTSATPSQP